MEAKEAVEILEKNSIFLEWKKKFKNSYLANAFIMYDSNKESEWQIGYYNLDSDKITTFNVGEKISKNPESEVFKKSKTVAKLNLDKIKININDAVKKSAELQKQKYPQNYPLKKIIILQNYENNNMYNITFVTQTFNTLNIKISSETGKLLSHKLQKLFDFSKPSNEK